VTAAQATSAATWIVGAVLLAAGIAGLALAGVRARRSRAARARVLSLESSTSADPHTGAVRSVQCGELLIDSDALQAIWSPTHLERLARTYWRFLTRATLGLIRVRYTDTERSVVLLLRPLRLLTFDAPEYELDGNRGLVRWRIARGLLVARRGHDGGGHLQIEVRRSPSSEPGREHLQVEVEVANFYPSIASGLGLRLYNLTQSRIHVFVTYGFLRSLARLDLAESRVGRLAAPG
jgi:hypothetical protein